MNNKFDHKTIEEKWRQHWLKDNIYAAEDFSKKPKKYILAEFPYPSGLGLHAGHMMRYTMPDVLSRKFRMSGYNVLFPMGWDAFGLPAENYAVKTGVHPAETTQKAIDNYTYQLNLVGYGFDWSREINSTDPKYYKWTQWLFLKFYEEGLAELKEEPVWWSEELRTVLANEEVVQKEDGRFYPAERGKEPVERKLLKQWVLKIPQYADKLINGLAETDLQQSVKSAQINWIGRSEGAEIDFEVKNLKNKIRIFTTRLDTIYGATFLVLAPEHSLVQNLTTEDQEEEVQAYIEETNQKTEFQRLSDAKSKTGVFTGTYAINPFSGKEIPIWISDFVLTSYGTGAIMSVPAHDERDFEFAKKFGLEIVPVIRNDSAETRDPSLLQDDRLFTDHGILINSGEYDGLTSSEAFEKMITKAEKEDFGEKKVHYKIKDWLFSRQRYWGEPIPLIHKEDGSVEAIVKTTDAKGVSEKLPLILPQVPDYTPSSDGFSPLAKNTDWVNTLASDGSSAKRETNTMPNWAGSSWYYMRYVDPKNDKEFADFEKLKYWLPVDMYFGGAEHTTLHLLYSRFWHKFLYDQGLVPTPEPYQWRMNGGILLGSDGDKMSKSKGNVINPNDKIEQYGADALRLYVCFMGPYDGTITWNENGLRACRNFLDTIYSLQERITTEKIENKKLDVAYNKMVKNVTRMIDDLKMNTSISEFMIFINEAKQAEKINIDMWKGFIKTIAPFAVFVAEDLWQSINKFSEWKKENSVHLQSWPTYDEALTIDDTIILGVQINGKIRGEVEVALDESEDSVKIKALANENVKKWIEGKKIKKFIYIKEKIISIVI